MKNIVSLAMLVILLAACNSTHYKVIEQTYPDGSPKVVKYYKSESMEVLLKETQLYNDSSNYIEGTYKDGMRDGIWTAWYPNGNVWSTGNYKEGKEHGKKIVYYENGQKYYEGVKENDQRLGVWTFWDEDGKELNTIDYDQP